ncbi:guanyl-nucleotide exchange factor [Lithospermum erythrorhizon]|uniref:Guanyl-nucleotide exchange factor n=1 Tax=Lithospermum erythrorhizon TaxID=34254 RepID=A0AAV3PGP6_LITER
MNGIGSEVDEKKHVVLMCGYLPGATESRSPLTSPVVVRLPATEVSGDCWEDVCGGGCGFAMGISVQSMAEETFVQPLKLLHAISELTSLGYTPVSSFLRAESRKLITWGSADDQGHSYLASGKHGEIPEPFHLPVETPIRKAAAGWAHIVLVTEKGVVFTWGWKECVPSQVKLQRVSVPEELEGDISAKLNSALIKEVSPQSRGTTSTVDPLSLTDGKSSGEETIKRRKTSSASGEYDSSSPVDETLSVPPCIVTLDPGVKITSVAAGGRHTLVLSDVGQVWGWGYGGEGQLGLGSRIKTVNSPHLIPCIEQCSNGQEKPNSSHQGSSTSTSVAVKYVGSCIKAIACGGRHSAVITDTGALLTFGWGSYGQCGHGNKNDVVSPSCVSSLLDKQIKAVAAGLWHTLCITTDGHVHAFGGNQFGQLGLGIGSDEAETSPKLLKASLFENKNAKTVSCGARHSTILTEDGSLFSWGWNKYGQLGLGDTIDRNIPSEVTENEYRLRNVSCGWWHTLLLAEPI